MPALMLLACFGALYCLGRGVLAMPANPLHSLIGPGLVIGGCVVFLAWAAWKGAGSAHIALSYHATPYLSARKIQIHEEAHKRKAAQFGAGGRIVEHPDGGYEFLPGWGWSSLTPVQKAAVCYAGQRAAGPGGHHLDDEAAEHYLQQVPAAQRDAARREAWRLAA